MSRKVTGSGARRAPRPAPPPDAGPDPQPEPERPTTPAAKLTPDTWIVAEDPMGRELVAEVHHVMAYRDHTRVHVVFSEPAWRIPESRILVADEPVTLATREQIADAQADARREQLCAQLRQLADVIREVKPPLPEAHMPVHVGIRLPDADAVAAAANVLGLRVDENPAGRSEVEWSAQDLGEPLLYADWYAYAPRDEHDPTARVADAGEPGLRVPGYVVGVPAGAPAGRVVSAPPAGEAGAS